MDATTSILSLRAPCLQCLTQMQVLRNGLLVRFPEVHIKVVIIEYGDSITGAFELGLNHVIADVFVSICCTEMEKQKQPLGRQPWMNYTGPYCPGKPQIHGRPPDSPSAAALLDLQVSPATF